MYEHGIKRKMKKEIKKKENQKENRKYDDSQSLYPHYYKLLELSFALGGSISSTFTTISHMMFCIYYLS
jgi:hypothetical protein